MTNENYKTLGNRLRLWRKSLGKTQIEFSKLSDVGIAIIRKCELDASTPGGKTLFAFAKTGVNIQWLLTGEGKMAASDEIQTRAYSQKLIDLGLQMAELSDAACEDILTEMSIKIKNYLHLQRIDRSLAAIKMKESKEKSD